MHLGKRFLREPVSCARPSAVNKAEGDVGVGVGVGVGMDGWIDGVGGCSCVCCCIGGRNSNPD